MTKEEIELLLRACSSLALNLESQVPEAKREEVSAGLVLVSKKLLEAKNSESLKRSPQS